MKGDFSRDPRSTAGNYAGVLMQQGRVQLDTHFNAQSAIARDQCRTLARDLVGPHGGPADRLGFRCITDEDGLHQWLSLCSESDAMASKDFVGSVDWTRDFLITPGRYYVDGLLAENDSLARYAHHAGSAAGDSLLGHEQVVYLRVFERVVTGLDDSRLRNPALGGHHPPTADWLANRIDAGSRGLHARARPAGRVKIALRPDDGENAYGGLPRGRGPVVSH